MKAFRMKGTGWLVLAIFLAAAGCATERHETASLESLNYYSDSPSASERNDSSLNLLGLLLNLGGNAIH
ncbi:MAG TPA: hypothetical protein VMF06_01920 [Candidatus Limnocylindria bacterium]|jgi:hypothetical protein|nr:hypothetical protein [Candidatus Limnocylindria bacterium]